MSFTEGQKKKIRADNRVSCPFIRDTCLRSRTTCLNTSAAAGIKKKKISGVTLNVALMLLFPAELIGVFTQTLIFGDLSGRTISEVFREGR